MKNLAVCILLACTLLGISPAFGQVKMTRDQMLFYTSDWKGDRFPDGRPKLPDALLKRVVIFPLKTCGIFCERTAIRISLKGAGRRSTLRGHSLGAHSPHSTCQHGQTWRRPSPQRGKRKGA